MEMTEKKSEDVGGSSRKGGGHQTPTEHVVEIEESPSPRNNNLESPRSRNGKGDYSEVSTMEPISPMSHNPDDQAINFHDIEYLQMAFNAAHDITDREAEKMALVAELIGALLAFSMPTFILKEYIGEFQKAMKLERATFLIEPSGIWASMGPVTRYVPVSPTYHLRRWCVTIGLFLTSVGTQNLQDAESLAQDLIMGEFEGNLDKAKEDLETILSRTKDGYTDFQMWLTWPVLCCTMAIFFYGGGWIEGGWAALFGSVCGWFWLVSNNGQHPHLCKLQSFFASFFVSVMCSILYVTNVNRCNLPITLGVIIYWLPGYSVTFGTCEILYGLIVMGASRYAAGVTYGMMMALGIAAGVSLVKLVDGRAGEWLTEAQTCSGIVDQHPLYNLLFIIPCFIASAIQFNMHWRQFPVPFACTASAYTVYYSLSKYGGLEGSTSSAFGAAVVVFVMGLAKRFEPRLSSATVVTQAVFVLVPGSFTVRYAFSIFYGNFQGQNQAAFTALIATISLNIATGLLVGAAILSGVFKVVSFKAPPAKVWVDDVKKTTENIVNQLTIQRHHGPGGPSGPGSATNTLNRHSAKNLVSPANTTGKGTPSDNGYRHVRDVFGGGSQHGVGVSNIPPTGFSPGRPGSSNQHELLTPGGTPLRLLPYGPSLPTTMRKPGKGGDVGGEPKWGNMQVSLEAAAKKAAQQRMMYGGLDLPSYGSEHMHRVSSSEDTRALASQGGSLPGSRTGSPCLLPKHAMRRSVAEGDVQQQPTLQPTLQPTPSTPWVDATQTLFTSSLAGPLLVNPATFLGANQPQPMSGVISPVTSLSLDGGLIMGPTVAQQKKRPADLALGIRREKSVERKEGEREMAPGGEPEARDLNTVFSHETLGRKTPKTPTTKAPPPAASIKAKEMAQAKENKQLQQQAQGQPNKQQTTPPQPQHQHQQQPQPSPTLTKHKVMPADTHLSHASATMFVPLPAAAKAKPEKEKSSEGGGGVGGQHQGGEPTDVAVHTGGSIRPQTPTETGGIGAWLIRNVATPVESTIKGALGKAKGNEDKDKDASADAPLASPGGGDGEPVGGVSSQGGAPSRFAIYDVPEEELGETTSAVSLPNPKQKQAQKQPPTAPPPPTESRPASTSAPKTPQKGKQSPGPPPELIINPPSLGRSNSAHDLRSLDESEGAYVPYVQPRSPQLFARPGRVFEEDPRNAWTITSSGIRSQGGFIDNSDWTSIRAADLHGTHEEIRRMAALQAEKRKQEKEKIGGGLSRPLSTRRNKEQHAQHAQQHSISGKHTHSSSLTYDSRMQAHNSFDRVQQMWSASHTPTDGQGRSRSQSQRKKISGGVGVVSSSADLEGGMGSGTNTPTKAAGGMRRSASHDSLPWTAMFAKKKRSVQSDSAQGDSTLPHGPEGKSLDKFPHGSETHHQTAPMTAFPLVNIRDKHWARSISEQPPEPSIDHDTIEHAAPVHYVASIPASPRLSQATPWPRGPAPGAMSLPVSRTPSIGAFESVGNDEFQFPSGAQTPVYSYNTTPYSSAPSSPVMQAKRKRKEHFIGL